MRAFTVQIYDGVRSNCRESVLIGADRVITKDSLPYAIVYGKPIQMYGKLEKK